MAPALMLASHFGTALARTLGDGMRQDAGRIFSRDEKPPADPSRGVLDPHDISNIGFFVLFALIGVAFIVTGIWFFFWAKNGGFHFKQNDWEEYKSTVLRRRGPNGTLLTGATPSTKLGGGSVYKDVAEDDTTTVVTESTGLSGITAGASDIAAREKRKAKQEQRQRERRKQRADQRNSKRHIGTDGVLDEVAEKEAKKELRSYRHERSARVGGLNKESDGSQWDGSTNPSDSTVSSELLSNRQTTPTSTPNKKPKRPAAAAAAAIRKVHSTAEGSSTTTTTTTTTTTEGESERIRAEARRLREESRSSRRDFSYNRPGASSSAATESLLEGSEVGTKSYHHPMPELRAAARDREREDRRARRGGYRRGKSEDDEL
ncbi:hypothetical protein AAL_08199 [Moelleriella libera RCEF 2490]|uniref:Endosomal SPRY domain protein n=1 Tax=Moelleriella libera RCEF 2490 TaxID=1081109 RepID=A0A167VUZ5_9HYPO|nr:hypothetical protein AAL_08199 [Moelleriella libera RCEF 2490]